MPDHGARERLRLQPEQLRHRLDPGELPFETTADVPPLVGTIGQPRAIDAITFGMEIPTKGYNIYVAGASGSGRETTVMDFLNGFAKSLPPPSDWIYVHNFADADRPNVIELPAGGGVAFAREMHMLIATAQREIPRAFESDEYDRRRRAALNELTQQRNAVLSGLQAFAHARQYALEMTPAGIASLPTHEGKPMAAEDFERLAPEAREELARQGQEVQAQVNATLRELRQIDKLASDRLEALNRDIALFVVGPVIDDLREAYALNAEILAYLDQVQKDLPEHLHDFWPAVPEPSAVAPAAAQLQLQQRDEHLARYEVNILVDNSRTSGAPIIFERSPTYYNLIGRVDYRPSLGTMVTDFQQIKAGALHRANGGFLLLQATDLFRNPNAWEALKRSLLCREIQIENFGDQHTPIPTTRVRPEPVPLDVKVVLIGPSLIYHTLLAADEDFQELFRVKADFAPDMEWSQEHILNYAAFISREVRESRLRHFDRSAVARVVEYGARLREHQGKLSTRLLDIGTVVIEASYWAVKAGHDPVMAADVDKAIDTRVYRSNLVEERLGELIDDGTIMIDVDGKRLGQVNGLSILDLGDYSFGKPTRISARVGLGRGSIISVEREIEMSGPIHSKGVLILTGYLSGAYGDRTPLAISATITFEQAYEGVDGDSASSTELYALLSVLSGLPLEQGIAVTGSVNQYGDVQAVGGVTRKIEGFFETCKALGLTGRQGVIIPDSNVKNLMLDDEVIQATRDGTFSIWAVRTIDEGIEILTGVPAGTREASGRYPEGTVHRLVEDRLRELADRAHAFVTTGDGVTATPLPQPGRSLP